jgi:hypothetical protein
MYPAKGRYFCMDGNRRRILILISPWFYPGKSMERHQKAFDYVLP